MASNPTLRCSSVECFEKIIETPRGASTSHRVIRMATSPSKCQGHVSNSEVSRKRLTRNGAVRIFRLRFRVSGACREWERKERRCSMHVHAFDATRRCERPSKGPGPGSFDSFLGVANAQHLAEQYRSPSMTSSPKVGHGCGGGPATAGEDQTI